MRTTSTPAAEWPPGGAVSSSRSASQGRASTDFGALLDTHQARTAVAEGPQREAEVTRETTSRGEPTRPSADAEASAPPPTPAEGEADAPQAGAPQADEGVGQPPQPATSDTAETPAVAVESPAVAVESLAVAVESLADVATSVLTAPSAPVQKPAPQHAAATGQQQVPPSAVAAQPARGAAEPVATAAPQPLGPVTATPHVKPVLPDAAAAQAQQQPVQAQPKQQVAVPQVQKGEQQPEQAKQKGTEPATARAAAAAVANAASERPAQPQTASHPTERPATGDQRPQVLPQPAQQRPGTATGARSEHQPTAQFSPSTHQTIVPVTSAAVPPAIAARADAPARTVHLSQAADAVENVIRLGAQRGVSHARLSLRPAELGGVEIHLQQTAAGLTASVVADGKEAAQVLQQAGQELRRQLESQGIQLQSLDISHSGEERSDARTAADQAGDGERGSQPGDSPSTATDGGELNPTDQIGATSTLELPDGVLVDVLA